VKEIKELVSKGYKEVTFLGQNIEYAMCDRVPAKSVSRMKRSRSALPSYSAYGRDIIPK
jgi:tRNA A37 methylthiotransferase MiaB